MVLHSFDIAIWHETTQVASSCLLAQTSHNYFFQPPIRLLTSLQSSADLPARWTLRKLQKSESGRTFILVPDHEVVNPTNP